MPYGPHFTRMRKTLQQPFNRGEVGKYLPVHEQEVNTLLKNLLEEPRDVDRHVHRCVGILISFHGLALRSVTQILDRFHDGNTIWTSRRV